MEYKTVYSKQANRDLARLPIHHSQRIIRKVRFFRTQSNPLEYAKKLKNNPSGTYRFRIGDYRVLFDVDPKNGQLVILVILSVKHRKNAYQ